MANDYFRKGKSLYSSTTNSFSTGESETITPASIVGLPIDTDITLTFDRSVTGKVERIIGQISGSNFAINSSGRGADGTSEQAHTSPTVEYIPNAKDMNDQVDGILVEHDQDGTHDATKVLTLTGTQTTTNKTLTTPVIASFCQDVAKTKVMTTPNTASDTLAAIAATQTLTNKRITPRVVTATDDATAVIDVDVTDQYQLTAVANATEFTVTGTPVNGQKLIIRLKDAGAGKALTWTGFTAIGVTLPTTTVANKTHYVGCIYNSAAATWDAVAVVAQA